MPNSTEKRKTRTVNPIQFGAFFIAIVLVGGLIGGLGAGLMLPAIGAAGTTIRALPETFRDLPSNIGVIRPSEGSTMLDSDGRVMARFYTERRIIVTSEQIPQVMKDAIISIEDRRFYSHHGIDTDGMMRAVLNNWGSGGTQGASTITQQYVKNILMEQGIQAGDQELIEDATAVSAERKLREARYALALESQMTKEEILTGYLNLAPFGTNIYGVEAASRAFFSKPAADLTLGEAATLAGTVQSPSLLDPLVNPDAAQERRDIVLQWMLAEGHITAKEYGETVTTNVIDTLSPELSVNGCAAAGDSAYYCTYAVQEFLSDSAFGKTRAERENLLNTGGLTLRTNLKADIQEAAHQAAIDLVPEHDPSGLDTAIVSMVPSTGELVSMAQNTTFGATTEAAPRNTEVSYAADIMHGGGDGFPTGSTFKVFTILEWFYKGHNSYDVVGGRRSFPNGSFKCHGQPVYTENWMVNDLPGKDGAMTVLRALNISANQVFVNMAAQMDLCEIMDRAASLGVTQPNGEPLQPFAPNILGSEGSPPIDMLEAFATIGNDGMRCSPNAIAEVEDRTGNVLKTYTPDCKRAIESTVAQKTTDLLESSASRYAHQIGRPFAAKSGTTDNSSNTWLVGFVPQLATAAWAGTATESSRPATGLVINGVKHGPIYGETFTGKMWANYMKAALADTPVETFSPKSTETKTEVLSKILELIKPGPTEQSTEQSTKHSSKRSSEHSSHTSTKSKTKSEGD